MKLTQEQRDKLLHDLAHRAPQGPRCSLCASNQWTLSDVIFELREFQGGNLVLGGAIYPVLPMMCSRCGNVLFLNAITAGLVSPDVKAPEPDVKASEQGAK